MQEDFEIIKPEAQHKKSDTAKVIGLVAAFLTVALISVLLTFSLTVNYFHTAPNNEYRDLALLKKYIDQYSYYDADHDAMLEAALKAYASSTGDRYTVYYDTEEFAALAEDNEGRYVGIGVTVKEVEIVYMGESIRIIEIVKVADNSPASEAKLLVGDMIYSLYENGEEIFANDVGKDAFSSMIRGEEGTYAEISVLRPSENGYDKIDVTLQRRKVENKSVEYASAANEPTVGVVTVSQFDLNTPVLLSEAFGAFAKRGINKVVIDLRDNPGGDLNSVIACASYFVNEGDVIISAEDNANNVVTYKALSRTYGASYSSCNVAKNDIGKFKDFEIAVLVNGNTASAAELLTAVFRDYELATVIGENTFGKGTMQTIYSLERYGLEGGIKITTSVYFPPCGENYDGVGIAPDIVVNKIDGEVDNQLLAAIDELTK